MPMPNAIVATTTRVSPRMNASCVASRTRRESPAWYGAAATPRARERRSQLLGAPPRGGVDDARAVGVDDGLQQLLVVRARVDVRADGEVDLRPIEAAHQHPRIAHPQALDDLLPHGRRRRRGQRQHLRRPQLRGERAQPQVVRPEVVAPLADAVRLVDHEQRRRAPPAARRASPGARAARARAAGTRARRAPAPPAAASRARSPRDAFSSAAAGAPVVLRERGDLVALQRHERADDDRRAVEQRARHLVDRRLAGAGRHDREHVVARQHRLDGLALPRVELA